VNAGSSVQAAAQRNESGRPRRREAAGGHGDIRAAHSTRRAGPRLAPTTTGDPKGSEDMQKWEYVTVPLLIHATKQILDNWGDDGYELVAVVPGPNPEQLVAYMKRPKG
jgi:hypothetical protein